MVRINIVGIVSLALNHYWVLSGIFEGTLGMLNIVSEFICFLSRNMFGISLNSWTYYLEYSSLG